MLTRPPPVSATPRADDRSAPSPTARAGGAAVRVPAGYVLGLSGLRGVAALAIVVAHVIDYGPPTRAGLGAFEPIRPLLGLSVVLFFTLSGFLLYRRFAASIVDGHRRPDMRDYALGRFLRIVPAYWVILLVTGTVFSAALVRDSGSTLSLGRLTSDPTTLLSDALLIQNDRPSTAITGIGPAWTLAIEVVFYAVMPLLALPIIALVRRRGTGARGRILLALVPPLVLLVGGAMSHAAGRLSPSLAGEGWGPDWSAVYHRSFAYNAALFAPGMVTAVVAVLLADGRATLRAGRRRGVLVGGLAILVAATALHGAGAVQTSLYEGAAAVAFALVVLSLATGEHGALARLLEWRGLVLVGMICTACSSGTSPSRAGSRSRG